VSQKNETQNLVNNFAKSQTICNFFSPSKAEKIHQKLWRNFSIFHKYVAAVLCENNYSKIDTNCTQKNFKKPHAVYRHKQTCRVCEPCSVQTTGPTFQRLFGH